MELRIEHLTKKYGKKTALSDFSVTLQNGTYALLGPNGAGKTTLISILVGALRQTAGEIYCDGENVRNIPKKYAVGRTKNPPEVKNSSCLGDTKQLLLSRSDYLLWMYW